MSDVIQKVRWPEQQGWIPSEFMSVSDLGYIVSTLAEHPHQYTSVPFFQLNWDVEQGLRVSAAVGQHEHARNVSGWILGDSSVGFVMADHGPDRPPFEGGQSACYFLRGGKWRASALPGGKAFHFDVAQSANLIAEKRVCVMPNLNSEKAKVFVIDSSGNFAVADFSFPSDLTFDKYMTAEFADIDGDTMDELILGGRGGSRCDYILKFCHKEQKFSHSNIILPNKKFLDWETVCILVDDLDQEGRLDIVTLNHDRSISHGTIEIYRKDGEDYRTLSLPKEIEELHEIQGQWLHRVRAVSVFSDERKDLLITVRRSDYSKDLMEDQVILLRNFGGGQFERFQVDHPLVCQPVLGADIVKDAAGSNALLIICFDGSYCVARIQGA